MSEVVGMTTAALSCATSPSLEQSLVWRASASTTTDPGTMTFAPGGRALVRAPACARRPRTIDFDVAERLYSFALVRWPHAQRWQLVISESMSLDPRVRPHTVTLLCVEREHVESLRIDQASERITADDVLAAPLTLLLSPADPSAI
jgi:hypothetical protein